MTQDAPKPGPHLHSIVLKSPGVPARPSFRDLAKHHARAAAELATDADEELALRGVLPEALVDLAQTHALAALACSAVAPVARQRLMPCKAGAK